MSNFVKLYGTITTSSVWVEAHGTRLVWITMLAIADQNGIVEAAIPGLANVAHVSLDEAIEAIRVLSSPDIHSRTETNEGRRIEKVPGGWRIINHRQYRDLRTDKQVADAERQRRHREGDRDESQQSVTERDTSQESRSDRDMSRMSHTEAEVEVETTTTPPPPPAHAQSPTGSSAQALVSIVPAEFRQDMEFLLSVVPSVTAWTAEMRASLDGMHGKPVTVRQLGQAVRDYVASGKAKANPNLRSFRRFIKGVLEGDDVPHGNITPGVRAGGKTLVAATLIQQLRSKRNQQFPNSIPSEWRVGLSPKEQAAIQPFLSRIMADDPKGEGTLVAQLSRALEEAQ